MIYPKQLEECQKVKFDNEKFGLQLKLFAILLGSVQPNYLVKAITPSEMLKRISVVRRYSMGIES